MKFVYIEVKTFEYIYVGERSSTLSDPNSDLTASNIFLWSGGRVRFILRLLPFAELLTVATAEAVAELEFVGVSAPLSGGTTELIIMLYCCFRWIENEF